MHIQEMELPLTEKLPLILETSLPQPDKVRLQHARAAASSAARVQPPDSVAATCQCGVECA